MGRYTFPHCVYFAEVEGPNNGGLIKIGTSTQVDIRMTSLKTRLLGVLPGSYAKEAEMHQRFALDHMHGEWFSDSRPLREFIATLPLSLDPAVIRGDLVPCPCRRRPAHLNGSH